MGIIVYKTYKKNNLEYNMDYFPYKNGLLNIIMPNEINYKPILTDEKIDQFLKAIDYTTPIKYTTTTATTTNPVIYKTSDTSNSYSWKFTL